MAAKRRSRTGKNKRVSQGAASPSPDAIVRAGDRDLRASILDPAVLKEAPEAERFLHMLNQLPQFVCLLSKDCSIRFTNRRFRELFGARAGQKCFESIRGQSEPCADCPIHEVLEQHKTVVREWRSASGRTYELHYYPYQDPDGTPGMLKLGNDITDRIRTEQKLTRERDKLQGILDGMKNGVYVIGPQHEVLFCNSAMATEFGPVNGQKCYQYVHGRSEPCPWCRSEKVFAGETVRHEWVSANAVKTYELVGTPVGNPDGSFSNLHVLHDITERKRVEEELRGSAVQLRSLSSRLLQVQETERTRLSRELHDVLAQSLGTLKLRLSLIRNHLHEGQQEAMADCDDTLHYMDQAIDIVRRLSRDLSPTILADLGLATAVRRLISQVFRNSQVQVLQRIEDTGRLPSYDDEILVYRVIQEALYNIQQHASARNVSVIMESRGHEMHCLVEDDGIGFDRAKLRETDPAKQGVGLHIMAERVRILGGAFDLESTPGKGTCITFSIPMQDVRTR